MILLYASTYEIERAHNPLTQVDLIVHAAILGRDPNKIFYVNLIMLNELKEIMQFFVDAEKIVNSYPGLSYDKKTLFKKYAHIMAQRSWQTTDPMSNVDIVWAHFPVELLFARDGKMQLKVVYIADFLKNKKTKGDINIKPEIDKETTFETLRALPNQKVDIVMTTYVNKDAVWDDVEKVYHVNREKIELDDAIQALLDVLKKDNSRVTIDPVVKF